MSKKIISFLLLAVMCCAMLISCGKTVLGEASDYINDHPLNTERERVTLNFYMISDIALSTEAIEAMERSFNLIIEAKYNTHVEFTFATEAEYAALVASKMQSTKETREDLLNGTIAEAGKTNASNTSYPPVYDSQFDIFLSTSETEFLSYVKSGEVIDLTSYIAKHYRAFSDTKSTQTVGGVTYHPTVSEVIFSNSYFLENIFENSSSAAPTSTTKNFYGIPCTYVIDSYDYLFVDKAYADRFYLGSSFPEDATANPSLVEAAATALRSELQNLKDENGDFYEDTAIDQQFIIRKENASYEDRFSYAEDQYYRCILRKPQTLYSEICSAMFCISSYTANAERSYEVLYELYTNPELHSILQYGVKDVTYTYDPSTKTVSLIDNPPYQYSVNLRYSGNMFCLYPCSDLAGAESYQALEYAHLQNMDANPPSVTANNKFVLQQNMAAYLRDLYVKALGTGTPLTSDDGGYENGAYNYVRLDPAKYADLADVVKGNPETVEVRAVYGQSEASEYYGYIVIMDDAEYRFFALPTDGSCNFRMYFVSDNSSFNTPLLTSVPFSGDLSFNRFTFSGIVENQETGQNIPVDGYSNIKITVADFTKDKGELKMSDQTADLNDKAVQSFYLPLCKDTICDYLNILSVMLRDSKIVLADLGLVRY